MTLPIEHIQVGNFLWYSGETTMFYWDCPAQITKIEGDQFWVMSLDDMREQSQSFDFEIGQWAPSSRKSMRPITKEEAWKYLIKRRASVHGRKLKLQAELDVKLMELDEQLRKIERALQ